MVEYEIDLRNKPCNGICTWIPYAEEPIVNDFKFLLRKTENEENMEGIKNARKKKYRMGFKKTR